AHELAPKWLALDLRQRIPSDKVAFFQLDDPPEARLERVRRVVDVVAVEGEARFEAERVARAEARRLEPEGLARGDERAPERGRVVPRTEDLDAVLAGVPRACRRRPDAGDGRVAEVEALEGRELRRLAAQRGEDVERAGPLESDERGRGALVLEVAVVLR